MEEVIAWFITGILVFVIGCVCGRSSHRRTGDGTGSDLDSVRDDLEGAGDDNRRLERTERATAERLREQAGTVERAADENRRSQQLVEKAQNLLRSAKHTNSDN